MAQRLVSLMNIEDFRSQIVDERLRALFDFWQGARGSRSMPDWADIKPEGFAIALPHTWVWRTDAAGELRLRIIGEAVMQIMEGSLKGKTPYDLYRPDQAKPIVERLNRVMYEPSCSYTIGEIQSGEQFIGIAQRLGLPYFDRLVGRPGVIGASVLDKRIKSPFDSGAALYSLTVPDTYLALGKE